MSLLARASAATARHLKLRGGHAKGSFFEAGHNTPAGNLFGESPLKPGETRKWESWEAPWYFTFGAASVMLYFGLNARPESSLNYWADKEAEKRVDAAMAAESA